jgi:BirA family transcriptional regulator, biotin operon repressor / biotin---[acetyl-CoA-carboxylase] ligase
MRTQGDDLLAEGTVARALERAYGRPWPAPVHVLSETGSTNDDAKALAREGAPAGTLFISDAQTAGRGRSGARWHSPPGENLYLSLVLRPDMSPAAVAPVTLVAGLVVAGVVDERTSRAALVKWPNDVHVDGKKVSGILVEGQVRGDALASIVVGVGVNVTTSSFPPPLDQTATSLAILGARDCGRTGLAAAIAVGLVNSVERFAREGLASFARELAARDALLGRRVRIGDVEGSAMGIDGEGRLLVATGAGAITPIASGHVELAT